VRAGKLDRKITVQRASETRNAYNEIEPVWADLFTVWASKKTQSGREALQAEQVVASNTVVFAIRYKAITTKDRVIFEGQTYDITSLNELGRREGLEIITTAHEQHG
jgi:SPP1 family predicted phage head-tail adaptor